MSDEYPTSIERDPRFPSGEWTGFYLQYWMPGRHKTDLSLSWNNGIVTGEGRDRVGAFTIDGTYDTATGKCEWKKQYVGRHSVAYRGVNDGRGIWGVWEIRLFGGLYADRGGFHLWPEGTDVSEASDATERAVTAAMYKEFGNRSSPFHPVVGALFLLACAGLGFLVWWKLRF
ncbi:MAG: hypothetical protein J0I06_12650 [Planctomycetes bacterium]|nr:hypothetical protein [Planctomycetota bacterium]